ncbi:hypothetical protein LB505_013588 [Fusarium chuoi]|nr:hypothetical protein LB505_013588 [Fusarium chuoi]
MTIRASREDQDESILTPPSMTHFGRRLRSWMFRFTCIRDTCRSKTFNLDRCMEIGLIFKVQLFSSISIFHTISTRFARLPATGTTSQVKRPRARQRKTIITTSSIMSTSRLQEISSLLA